jgi:1,2-diacylglycerol 3-alpha-glucosyltransferase
MLTPSRGRGSTSGHWYEDCKKNLPSSPNRAPRHHENAPMLLPASRLVFGEALSLKIWSAQPPFGQLAGELAGIAATDLSSCLDEQRQRGGRLGEIMRRRGLLDHETVHRILAAQARWTARALEERAGCDLFPWPASLSLCLPARNEQEVIADTLLGAVAVLPEFVEDFEVLVIDDGSQDQTAAIVARCAEQDSHIRLLRHEQNRGYGAAVATGLRAARGDLISFSDADGQFNYLDLGQLLAQLPSADVVVGYRYRRADPWWRRLNAWAWGRLIRLVLGVQLRDLDCALKLFPRQVVKRLRLTATGNAISAEIMAQCLRGGLKVRETPVRHYPRCSGRATGNALGVILRAFQELPSLWQYRATSSLPAAVCAAEVDAPRSGRPSLNGWASSVNGNGCGQASYFPTGSATPTRLRVCMLAACPFPANYGTPGSIREMAEAIADLGHEVHIVTYPIGEDIPLRGLHLHRVPILFGEAEITVGPTLRRPLYDLQMVLKTREVLHRYRPHVLHAHGYEAVLAGWLASVGTGLPLVCSGHNTMADELATYNFIRPRFLAQGLGQLLDAVVPRLASCCLPHSANMDRFFRSLGLTGRVGRVINFGINLDNLPVGDGAAVRVRYGLGRAPLILYTGVLDEFQRLDLLLEAMRRVSHVVPAAKLLIAVTIPNPKNAEALRRQTAALGLQDRVVFTEPQPLEAMPDFFAACDLAVVPRPRVPGFPIKLLNYMAARKPAVLFASSASHGMVHRHNVFLVSPDTPAALGEALIELLQDPDLRSRLGSNAYYYVRQHHDCRLIAQQIIAVYRQLLEGKAFIPLLPLSVPFLETRPVLRRRGVTAPFIAKAEVSSYAGA